MLSLILSIVAMAFALIALARIRQRAIHMMDALDRRRGSNPMPTTAKPPAPPNPPAGDMARCSALRAELSALQHEELMLLQERRVLVAERRRLK